MTRFEKHSIPGATPPSPGKADVVLIVELARKYHLAFQRNMEKIEKPRANVVTGTGQAIQLSYVLVVLFVWGIQTTGGA